MLEDGPGGRFIELQLVAYLRDYPQIAPGIDNFRVLLQECATEIDASNVVAQLEDQVIIWGADAVPYPVANILDDYIQTPACQYPYAFEAKLVNPNPDDPQTLISLPPWFNFNPDTLLFGLDKCGTTNSIYDADC